MPKAVPVGPGDLNRAQLRAKASDERRLRPRFVSIGDAARYLGCSRSHFYAALLPKVRTIRLGKRRLVDFDSLEQLGDKLLATGSAVAASTAPEVPASALGRRCGSPVSEHRPEIIKTARNATGARK